jgi:hypothetical protein
MADIKQVQALNADQAPTWYEVHKEVSGGYLGWCWYSNCPQDSDYILPITLELRIAMIDNYNGQDEIWEIFIPSYNVLGKSETPISKDVSTFRPWAAIWPRNPEQEALIDELVANYKKSKTK